MAIKTVETIRKIRDENYQATKNLSVEDQLRLINQKSQRLRKTIEPVAQMSLRASVASAAIPLAAEIALAAWSLPRNDEHLSVYATGSIAQNKKESA